MELKTFFMISLLFISNLSNAQTEISKTDRNKAIKSLELSKKEFLKTVKGLSTSQLIFKTSADAWSISECVEHMAMVEKNLFDLVQLTLQDKPDTSRRSEVKTTDEQLIGMISSRENKIKTCEKTEPKNTFGNYKNALNAFEKNRKTTFNFIKSTEEDLRNRYFTFPFATLDSYQLILFISSHSVRHTKQIKEIIDNSSFPR